MTQQKDYDAVKALREYYARTYDLKTDIEFMQWVKDTMQLIRVDDMQRVKAIFEKRSDTPGLINVEKIDGDRKHCDHCKRDYGLNYCHVCGGITCGNCMSLHTHSDPTTNAARPGE